MCFVLLDGWVEAPGKEKKILSQHPRFCHDWTLDTDDFFNIDLFIDEVSRNCTNNLQNSKNTLDNGIGIAAAAAAAASKLFLSG